MCRSRAARLSPPADGNAPSLFGRRRLAIYHVLGGEGYSQDAVG